MAGNRLRSALEEARPEVEAGLAAAEAELADLDARRAELVALIHQAQSALGQTTVSSEPASHMRGLTLHEALAQVLRENGNAWMTVRELATHVNGRHLYSKRDGSPVEANQVHARAKNYNQMFEKEGPRVRLRSA